MGSPLTRPAIMKVLTESMGQPVHVDRIVSQTGFTKEQVQSQMRNLIKDGFPVEVLVRASIWKYTEPAPAPEPEKKDKPDYSNECFEFVGWTHTEDEFLIRDSKGNLFRAYPML